jgi:hypothetical protein
MINILPSDPIITEDCECIYGIRCNDSIQPKEPSFIYLHLRGHAKVFFKYEKYKEGMTFGGQELLSGLSELRHNS